MCDSIITNNLLTEEEINELGEALKNENNETIDVDSTIEAELRFKKAMKYIHDNYEKKFSKMSLDDVFKWVFYLGINTDIKPKTVSIEDVMKIFNEAEFFESISNLINNNGVVPENTIINVDDENNVIRLECECSGCDCECSPAREDCCESEDPEKCVITIPMKRFNEMIGISEEKK